MSAIPAPFDGAASVAAILLAAATSVLAIARTRRRLRAASPRLFTVAATLVAGAALVAEWAPIADRPRQPIGAGAATLRGPVSHVRDGDTIEVAGRAVRLGGLHCPETGTSAGARARRAARDLVAGVTVRCALNGERSHDRLGRCRVAGGRDLAAALIRVGACARCAAFDPRGLYAAAQRDAGAWRGDMPGYCVR